MSSSIELGKPGISINSAGGVSVRQWYFNNSRKEIKYITLTYIPYNSVKDVVRCKISSDSEASCKLTGPIECESENFVTWENLWYNATVTTAEVKEVLIQYMDGTEELIDGKDIVDMYSKDSSYSAKRARINEMKQAYKCFKVFSCFKKMKDDEEMKFHVNQGLWLFILEVIGLICAFVIPVFGALIFMFLECMCIILSIECTKKADEGKRHNIPLLGKIKLIK